MGETIVQARHTWSTGYCTRRIELVRYETGDWARNRYAVVVYELIGNVFDLQGSTSYPYRADALREYERTVAATV